MAGRDNGLDIILPIQATHANHMRDHTLELQDNGTLIKCNGCKRPALGRMYRCKDCPSPFILHIPCMFAEPIAEPIAKHEFFPGLKFEFLTELPEKCTTKDCRDCGKHCQACARPTDGYVYRGRKQNVEEILFLHPCCFKLPLKKPVKDLQFELSDKKLSENCIWCGEKRLQGTVIGNTGWSYKCGDYQCHARCSMDIWEGENHSRDGNTLVRTNMKQHIENRLKRFQKCAKIIFKIFKLIIKFVVSVVIGDPTEFLLSLGIDILKEYHG